jgi:Na+/melibiose symporter-like transporter
MAFWALDFVGFSPAPGAVNGEHAMNGLTTLYTLIPAALSLAAVLVIWNFPLTAERHAKIREELEARLRAPVQASLETASGFVAAVNEAGVAARSNP